MISNIFLSPPFDMAGVLFGLVMGVASFPLVILIEAVILRLMKWSTIWYSLFASFLMNTATLILGFFLAGPCKSLIDTIYHDRVSYRVEDITLWIILWAMTVIIEGILLFQISGPPARDTWMLSLLINVPSYIVLFIMWSQ